MTTTVLNIILYGLIAVGILVPLIFLGVRAHVGRRKQHLIKAWRGALDKESAKVSVLDGLEQHMRHLVDRELQVLGQLDKLREDIKALDGENPDPSALRDIEERTAAAMQGLGEVMESQVNSDGQHVLVAKADELARRHADNGTAIARLDEVIQQLNQTVESPMVESINRNFGQEKPLPVCGTNTAQAREA